MYIKKIKNFLPSRLLYFIRLCRNYINVHMRKNESCSQVFSRIYEKNQWGSKENYLIYNSGSGSYDGVAQDFIYTLRKLISSRNIKTIVDVGCGDFRVGRELIKGMDVHYTGIDVVKDLVDYNNKHYGNNCVRFLCLDATTIEPPYAELCIIRQVFQHLNNFQIEMILNNTDHIPLRVVSEHVAYGENVVPNRDKPTGSDIRVVFDSGIFPEEKPFSRQITLLSELDLPFKGVPAKLRTAIVGNRK